MLFEMTINKQKEVEVGPKEGCIYQQLSQKAD